MPDPAPERPPIPPDQATRDIRLPPLPGRPAPAVPQGWTPYVPAEGPVDQPTDGPVEGPAAGDRPPRPAADEPTDKLSSPPGPPRDRTLSFQPAPSVQLLKVSVTPRRRRTGRFLWFLFFLIVAVLVACGVYLVLTVVQR